MYTKYLKEIYEIITDINPKIVLYTVFYLNIDYYCIIIFCDYYIISILLQSISIIISTKKRNKIMLYKYINIGILLGSFFIIIVSICKRMRQIWSCLHCLRKSYYLKYYQNILWNIKQFTSSYIKLSKYKILLNLLNINIFNL